MYKHLTSLLLLIFAINFYIPTVNASSISAISESPMTTEVILKNTMDCREQDSLVLAELYLATNSPGWDTPWDLSQPIDTWEGVTLNAEGCVEVLNLQNNNLRDTVPVSIWNLIHLKTLNLTSNFTLVIDSLPVYIDDLSQLEVLNLGQLEIKGTIPNSIGNLVNLTELDLGFNKLTGAIPSTITNLTNLTELELGINQLTAVPDLSNLVELKKISLNNNPLGGTIPNWLGTLTKLETIFWYDCQLTGTIPNIWNNLVNLRTLFFSNNDLTGVIPSSIGNNSIRSLSLGNNQLTGPIPNSILNSTSLISFEIDGNQFQDEVPNFSVNNTILRRLRVNNNQLTFEDILPNITANEDLIASNARFSSDEYKYESQALIGTTTSHNFIAGADYTFDLGIDVGISSNVYTWYKDGIFFQTLTGNNSLNLNNVTATDIGTYTCEVTNPNAPKLTLESHNYQLSIINANCRQQDSLVLVDLYNATNGLFWYQFWDLDQPMDTWYGVELNLDGCVEVVDLDGRLDSNCHGCYGGGNNLEGSIPSSFYNLSKLKVMSFGGNRDLTATLTSTIGNLLELEILTLSLVDIPGTIPSELGNLSQLKTIFMGNGLTGAIPSSLNNLVQLESFDASSNQLTSLPDLSNLTNLKNLDLSSNLLSGPIPTWLGELSELNYLYLRGNEFSGPIPESLGDLSNLMFLILNDNQLTGNIPASFSNLEALLILQLGDNQLDGSIPSFLSDLSNLTQARFHNNNFSGLVPDFANSGIRDMQIENNLFTFEDIIPNIATIESTMTNNGAVAIFDSLRYDPQPKIGQTTSYNLIIGTDYTFDLGIDDTVTSNIYTWYKDGNLLQVINGNNSLSINNASNSDVGVYTCEVTNSNAPDLTLLSFDYNLSEQNESSCDLSFSNPSNIRPMSCPGGSDASIDNYVESASGQLLSYELYDDNNTLLRTQTYSTFTNLSAGNYTFLARSLDIDDCTLSHSFEILEGVDETSPVANCLNIAENAAFVREKGEHHPFGDNSTTKEEMNTVFGHRWQDLAYEAVNPQLLFSDAYNFVYLEGSGNRSTFEQFSDFLSTNQQLIEDWVALGNSLFINAAPFSQVGNDTINLGFGDVELHYGTTSTVATAPNVLHPVFSGPHTPTSTSFTGSRLGYSVICPPAMNGTAILKNENDKDLLVEASWGNGTVIFGGLTTSRFMDDRTSALNFRKNILEYLISNAIPAANTPVELAIDESLISATLTPAMLNVGAVDNCELVSLEVNKTTFDCSELGVQASIMLSGTDASGNVGSCFTSVLITDPNNYCSDDSEDCQNERIMNDVSITNGTYSAATIITSSGTIQSDAIVLFKAGQSITLEAGFHALAGSDFTARIEACTPAQLQEGATERTKSPETKTFSNATELQLKAYPNPFNETATVDYYLPKTGQTTIRLMDFMGRAINQLSSVQEQTTGWHQLSLNATDLPTGTYFLVLQNEAQLKTTKLMVTH